MNYDEFMKESYPEITNDCEKYYSFGRIWNAAKQDTIAFVDIEINKANSFYQKKRDMLKKQVTHWIGKYMIVKTENNTLRRQVKRSGKCIAELLTELRFLRQEVNRGRKVLGISDLKSVNTIHEREPIQC